MMISRPTRFWFQLALLSLTSSALAQDVEIEVEAAPAAPAAAALPTQAAPALPASQAELTALRTQVAALEQRLAESEARDKAEAEARAREIAAAEGEAQARAQAARKEEAETAERARKLDLLQRVAKLGVTVSGYLQVQYGRSQLSEDQLLQGGSPLNQNRFAVRRGRLRVNGRWKYVRSDFELDGSNTRGPTVSVRRASVSGVLPSSEAGAPPYLLATAGLTEIPLGLELQQGQDEILFLERTTGSLAFFPGPVDTGAKLEAAYGPLRLQVAVMNGVPLDDRAGGPSGIDPTGKPDYLGRVGIDAKPADWARIAAGVSYLRGTGFHPGSDATKATLEWDDRNADGQLALTEIVQVAGRAALPSSTFERWAVAGDLELDVRTKLGWTRLYGELTLASNLDRGLFVADPTLAGSDIRELSWYAAFTQDLTEHGFVGLRYDVYDPDSDLIDNRRGKSVPQDGSIRTWAPLVGARWPGVARVSFQYDRIEDSFARDTRGVPTDVKNNQWTVRAQGEF
jgi:Skp family chaperone for outer membrane proteins